MKNINFLKTLQKGVAVLSVLAMAAAFVPAPVSAHNSLVSPSFADRILGGLPVGKSLTAVSTDTAIVVSYIGGAAGGGEVAVDAATGDITLTVATVADDTTECPVSGAYGGVIDVSDASCNTLGEVVDAINFSANWRAAIVAGLRSDSSNNTLVTISATTADSRNGLALKRDTAVALYMEIAFIPDENLPAFINDAAGGTSVTGSAINKNPFADHQTALFLFNSKITNTGDAAVVDFNCVKVTQARGRLNAAGTGFTGGSEVVTTPYSAPGGATTVNQQLSLPPLLCGPGEKLVAKVTGATTLTAPTINGYAQYFEYAK